MSGRGNRAGRSPSLFAVAALGTTVARARIVPTGGVSVLGVTEPGAGRGVGTSATATSGAPTRVRSVPATCASPRRVRRFSITRTTAEAVAPRATASGVRSNGRVSSTT